MSLWDRKGAKVLWLNFVGGRYDSSSFLEEAARIGVSRGVSRHSTVEFGDEVFLGRYSRKCSYVIGSFIVSRIMLKHVAEEVIQKLLEDGKTVTEQMGDPVPINRKCGKYTLTSVVSIDASLQEVAKTAKEVDPEAKILIGGELARTFNPPLLLVPAPKFAQGLIKLKYDLSQAPPWDGTAELAGVEGYQKY